MLTAEGANTPHKRIPTAAKEVSATTQISNEIADRTKAIQEHRDNHVQDYHHSLADIIKDAANDGAYAV